MVVQVSGTEKNALNYGAILIMVVKKIKIKMIPIWSEDWVLVVKLCKVGVVKVAEIYQKKGNKVGPIVPQRSV